MLTGEQVQFALNVAEMSAKNQWLYFKTLESVLTGEEIKSFQIVVSYLGMINNPEKMQAMKTAMAEKLYKEFNK